MAGYKMENVVDAQGAGMVTSTKSNELNGRPTPDEIRLERTAVELLTETFETRRRCSASGEVSIKVVHRGGRLVEIHIDDHRRLTAKQ